MPHADYTLPTFIQHFNEEIIASIRDNFDNDITLQASGLTDPTELTDVIQFNCNHPLFLICMIAHYQKH